ncbi:hypothetical protein G176_gp22 [Xanthomonas phage CP1]|uniref:GIY-YIG domain-containing protein n=1 Tax=Xanthomonas phage CP1 TaxID=2994055 RepID=I7GSL6_9CAUD|nr:hypothetical protein G176_gp22 [Xanthomonas phage CP1]BAM29094.1 hypothetical protein [Xanthomonas phage CP1]
MDNINLNQSGIYSITSPSGKRYVGSAVNIRKRWKEHRYSLKRGNHHCKALQRAYHKYAGNLGWSVVVLCHKDELIREEQYHIDLAGIATLYNSSPTAGSQLGMVRSEESRRKMQIAQMGKKLSEETKRKIGEDSRRRLMGKKQSRNTSGYVGISLQKSSGNWLAQIRISRKLVHLGSYPTAELANQARQNFDRILHYYDHS